MFKTDYREVLNELLSVDDNYIIKEFEPGNVIFHEGDICSNLSVIVEGSCLVIPSNLDGSSALIDTLEVGDFIGDFELFYSKEYYHTVESKFYTKIIMFDKSIISKLLEYKSLSNLLILNLVNKLEKSSVRTKYNNTLSTRDRLLEYLNARAVNGVFSRREEYSFIAKSINTSTRNLRRLFNQLEENGLIERETAFKIKLNKKQD